MSSAPTSEKSTLSVNDKFKAVMQHGDLSHGFPIMEWAPWWDKTLDNWHAQGLPTDVTPEETFGLDPIVQIYVPWWHPEIPEPETPEAGRVTDEASYDRLLPYLHTDLRLDEKVNPWTERRKKGEALLWFTVEGPFWYPRSLFGIQPHLFAFYTQPELMKRMISDYTDWVLKSIDALLDRYEFDFMTIAEDMSYNHGPMISMALMDEFMAPYYEKVIPALLKRGVMPIVDSDGQVEEIIPWFENMGVQGILPLERMAGVDVNKIRARHPKFRMIGGFDKTVMHKGEDAIRKELERIRPAVKAGYFIPGCDHQTPPAVSVEDYKLFIKLMREFSASLAEEAARG